MGKYLTHEQAKLTALRYAVVLKILKTDPIVAMQVKKLFVAADPAEAREVAREAKVPAKALEAWYVR